jgi:uncharacterized protein (TIGR02996 family)
MNDIITEADAFLRSILNDPSDRVRQLAFADWLEETDSRPNFIWAKYIRLADDLASGAVAIHERAKKARLLARIGNMVQAKLRYKAEVFLEHADAMRQLLPVRCMILDIETAVIPAQVRDFVPYSLVQELSILPLIVSETTITLTSSELTEEARETVEFLLNRRVEWVSSATEGLSKATEALYADPVPTATRSAPTLFISTVSNDTPQHRRTPETYSPGERILGLMFEDAFTQGIRDITIHRAGPRVEIRFLRNGGSPLWGGFPSAVHLPLIHELLRHARLPVETGEEQSGIFRFHLGQQFLDVALRVTMGVSGPQAHLSILPFLAEPPVAANSVA